MWSVEEAERFYKEVVSEKNKEIERLLVGIDKAIYCLANEDTSSGFVVDEIRMELIKLFQSGEVKRNFLSGF